MNTYGLSQAQYLALLGKTDMVKFRNIAGNHVVNKGSRSWEGLAKDATTQGFTTGTGVNFYDLRAPAYLIDQAFTPILNSTPRWDKTNAGYGVSPNWKAITNFDAAGSDPFVSEGNRNAYASVSEKDFSAAYKTLGQDDTVTFEAESASEGFDNVLGTGKQIQLIRFRRQQERTYIGGSTSLQLGTTPTPTAALSATAPAGTLATGSYAVAYCVALNYRASVRATNTVANGLTTQYARTNAGDGSVDVINGGTAAISAASAVVGPTTTPLPTILFSVPAVAGAWAYAWFVQSAGSSFSANPANAKLTAITSVPAFVYGGQTQGTQTAAFSGAGGYAGFGSDLSTNVLDMDGILAIASNSNYTTGLPTWSYPNQPSTIGGVTGTVTVLPGGVDLHGAGLTNGGMVGSITEIDSALQAIQLATMTSPTRMYISADVVQGFTYAFMAGATSSTQANFFFPNGGQGIGGLAIETHIASYFNKFALTGGNKIEVIQHPYLPKGTILFDVNNLGVAYEHSRLGETRGVFVRRDTYGIEYPQTTRRYNFGVYSEEVMACKAPHILAFIKGIGAFGKPALF